MKRLIVLFFAFAFVLSGCAVPQQESDSTDPYENQTVLSVPGVPFTLTNAEGEQLIHYGGELSGTMTVYEKYLSVGEPAGLTAYVPDSESFEIVFQKAGERWNSMLVSAGEYTSSVHGEGIERIYASVDSTTVVGESLSLRIFVSSGIEGYDLFHIKCEAEDAFCITRDDEKLLIDGIDGEYVIYFTNYSRYDQVEVTGTASGSSMTVDLEDLAETGQITIRSGWERETFDMR